MPGGSRCSRSRTRSLSGDTAKALTLVTELYDRAKEIDRICEELTGHFRDMLICRSVRDPSGMVVCLPDELERLRKQADSTPPERILAVLDDLQACSAALGKVPDKKVELEMTVIRLCGGGGKPAVQPQAEAAASADVAALQARIGELERLIASLSSAPGRLAPAAAAQETLLPEEQPVRAAPPEPPKSKPEPARPAPAPEPEPAPEPATEPLPQWEELLREMENREPALFSLMDGSTAVRSGENRHHLFAQPDASGDAPDQQHRGEARRPRRAKARQPAQTPNRQKSAAESGGKPPVCLSGYPLPRRGGGRRNTHAK